MIVLDTSAAVELLLGLPLAGAVSERIGTGDSLHAPDLLVLEFLQVLRRRVRNGQTTAEEAVTALGFLEDLDLTCHDHLLLARRIWTLHDSLSAYDAAYVALAELLDAPLVTSDARLARASGNSAQIELIGR